jgi:hypothetical protein
LPSLSEGVEDTATGTYDSSYMSGLLEGGRLFRSQVIKHARKDRNVGLVLDQRTEMIRVK